MNVISFCTKLLENDVKGYVVERSRRIFHLSFKMLKCSTIEEVLSKLDYVYDNIEAQANWTGRSRAEYFASFNRALQHFPILKSKIPKEYWAKLNKTHITIKTSEKKRKFIIDTDSEDDEVKSDNRSLVLQEKKKIKVIPINKPKIEDYSKLTFYELSMNDTLWKVYFIRKDDEVFVNQRSSKVKFSINSENDIKNYVIRVLEALIKEAYSINVILKCKLKYGQDNMNDIIINNATKNVRDVATHIWTEMVEPFYKVSMAF